MLKCRCGTWTNYGLTCASCRMPFSNLSIEDSDEEYEEEEEKKEEEKTENRSEED